MIIIFSLQGHSETLLSKDMLEKLPKSSFSKKSLMSVIFLKMFSILINDAFIWLKKYSKHLWFCEILQFKIPVIYFNVLHFLFIYVITTPVSVKWSFRNHYNMMISFSYYYQCWKRLCCFIFLWKPWYYFFKNNYFLWWKFKRTFTIYLKCLL